MIGSEYVQGQYPPSFGLALDAIGDVTGDGLPDLAIGAPQLHDFANPEGRRNYNGIVYVVAGKTDTASQLVNQASSVPRIAGTRSNTLYGIGVSALGDVDGDGAPDFAFASTAVAPEDGSTQLNVVRTGPAPPVPCPPVQQGCGGEGGGGGGGNGTQDPVPPPIIPPTPPTVVPPVAAPPAATPELSAKGKKAARKLTLTLSKPIALPASRTFRVQLVQRGKVVATGTVRGTRLVLTVSPKSAKAKKKTYPRLRGAFTLRAPAKHRGKKLPRAQRIARTDLTIS